MVIIACVDFNHIQGVQCNILQQGIITKLFLINRHMVLWLKWVKTSAERLRLQEVSEMMKSDMWNQFKMFFVYFKVNKHQRVFKGRRLQSSSSHSPWRRVCCLSCCLCRSSCSSQPSHLLMQTPHGSILCSLLLRWAHRLQWASRMQMIS